MFRLEDALRAGRVSSSIQYINPLNAVLQHAHFLELGVIRTFDFVSALRRMSVIVKRLKSNSMEIYVKGAPEVMAEICDKSTCECVRHVGGDACAEDVAYPVPQDYDDLLSYYTKRGYRVIAMAGKSIEGLSWLKAQKLKRYTSYLTY